MNRDPNKQKNCKLILSYSSDLAQKFQYWQVAAANKIWNPSYHSFTVNFYTELIDHVIAF